MSKITFIIPTIGRDTLTDTINSLLNQTCPEWNAIIIFDGVKPFSYETPFGRFSGESFNSYARTSLRNCPICTNAENNTRILSAAIQQSKTAPEDIKEYGTIDTRFRILQTEKMDRQYGLNSAGYVRNYGIQFATTEWIAFVDDDDTIKSTYVETFLNEAANYDNDVILFRMARFGYGELKVSKIIELIDDYGAYLIGISESDFQQLKEMDPNTTIRINTTTPFPPARANDIVKHDVGISFAAKKHIFDSGIWFETTGYEDFEWLDKVKQNKYKMMISPYVLYFIQTTYHSHDVSYNRVFINHPSSCV